MYSNPFEIQIQKKLSDLAEVLVPETFRSEAPQYYGIVKAMLTQIQDVQDSLNNNLLDLVDPDKITTDAIAQIYFNTYLAQLQLDDSKEFLAGKDMLKVAKDLSLKKGTISLYYVLINMLTFLLPGVSNTYSALIEMLKNPDLTPAEIILIQQDIDNLKDAGLTGSYVDLQEDVLPFKYTITADIDMEAFYNFVKPFCHPAGWQIEFTQMVVRYVKEVYSKNEAFSIMMAFEIPGAELTNTPIYANQAYQNTNNNAIEPFYPLWSLGSDSNYLAVKATMFDPRKLYTSSGNLYYDFGQITFSKFTINQEITDFGSDETQLMKQTRVIEPLWKFPDSVWYSANKAYGSNTRDLVTNGGCISNYGGKMVMHKYIVSNDLASMNTISDN